MSHTAATIDQSKAWGGDHQSPFRVSYGKIYMWFFLVSDAFTFSALLIAYGFMRHKFFGVWPVAGDVFVHFPFMGDKHIELLYVGFMTFILIMSSVTMVLAVEAGHRLKKETVIKWLFLTIIGGFIFLGSQVWEWYHFIHGTEHGALLMENGTVAQFVGGSHDAIKFPDGTIAEGAQAHKLMEAGQVIHGANLIHNEYGHNLFADFFFFITGFHGFHVFSGVMINIVVLIMTMNGVFEKRGHYETIEKAGLYWHFVDLVWVFVFTFFYLL